MEGQLNPKERKIITSRIHEQQPSHAVEVGTWLGGGSTLHILKAMEENMSGHLWGIEASQGIYDRMIANIRSAGEEHAARFTPVFGFSQQVIPGLLDEIGPRIPIGFVFLDGGDNPMEQVEEFQLLRDRIPVGGVLLSHDAKLRKGKWLVPYLRAHDNWECLLHDISDEGLFEARKIADQPSEGSREYAAQVLRKLRREPKELIGRHLPSWLIDIILKLLPRKWLLSLTQNRH
jgi:predicted O-methyltransferase YrrM